MSGQLFAAGIAEGKILSYGTSTVGAVFVGSFLRMTSLLRHLIFLPGKAVPLIEGVGLFLGIGDVVLRVTVFPGSVLEIVDGGYHGNPGPEHTKQGKEPAIINRPTIPPIMDGPLPGLMLFMVHLQSEILG